MSQEDVDGRGFALAPLLHVKLEAGLPVHVFPHDLFGAVGATRGDDDDLGDLDFEEPLVDDRLQQPADVRFLVVGGDAHAASDLVFAHADPTTVRHAMRAVRGNRSQVSLRASVRAIRLGRK